MKHMNLKALPRDTGGKKVARQLRRTGGIPAVLYGHKREAMNLTVGHKDLWHILHAATSEHMILNLDIEGSSEGTLLTLVREVQHHPVTGDVLHLDLLRISIDEKLHIGVPIELTGLARGVKDQGGVLDHGIREVTLNVKPMEIPDKLSIDVSELAIGQSLHVEDLMKIYPDLEFVDDAHVSIAHVSTPKKLEALIPAAGTPAEAAVAPEEGEGAEGEGEAGEGGEEGGEKEKGAKEEKGKGAKEEKGKGKEKK